MTSIGIGKDAIIARAKRYILASQPRRSDLASKKLTLFPAAQEPVGSPCETLGREADVKNNPQPTPPSESKDRTQFQGRIHLLPYESGRLIQVALVQY